MSARHNHFKMDKSYLKSVHQVATVSLAVAPGVLERVALVGDELVAGGVERGQVGIGRCTCVGAPIHRELCKLNERYIMNESA